MKLGYDPKMMSDDNLSDDGGFVLSPGQFKFEVREIGDKVSSGGYNGCNVVLLVENGAPWEQLCFSWYSYEHKPGLARLRALLENLGLAVEPPPEDWQVKGGKGEAEFVVKEYTDRNGEKRQGLEVKKFINNKSPALSSQEQPPLPRPGYQQSLDDDAPF